MGTHQVQEHLERRLVHNVRELQLFEERPNRAQHLLHHGELHPDRSCHVRENVKRGKISPHHQVMLFFYMIILLLIFVIQFSVACACLGVDKDKELQLAEAGWNAADNETKYEAEQLFQCCGFTNDTDGIDCEKLACYDSCPPCSVRIQDKINYAFNAAGGLGLFFSFTDLISIAYAFKFRQQLRLTELP